MKLKCPILQPSNKDISFTSTIENPIFILFLKVLKKKKLRINEGNRKNITDLINSFISAVIFYVNINRKKKRKQLHIKYNAPL